MQTGRLRGDPDVREGRVTSSSSRHSPLHSEQQPSGSHGVDAMTVKSSLVMWAPVMWMPSPRMQKMTSATGHESDQEVVCTVGRLT